jgi:hypothetical protein
LNIQEPLLAPEKLPSPTQEVRNDVSMNTHLSIFYSIDLHLIRQETLFRMKLYHHQFTRLLWMT